MTSSVLKFGDIFNYHEKDYVFLVKTEDSIYAAQILPLDLSRQIQQKHNKVLRDTRKAMIAKHNILYCYVVLKTDNFKERIAHFADSEHDETSLILGPPIDTLEDCDLNAIREEILDDYSMVPRELKKLIKDIYFKKNK